MNATRPMVNNIVNGGGIDMRRADLGSSMPAEWALKGVQSTGIPLASSRSRTGASCIAKFRQCDTALE